MRSLRSLRSISLKVKVSLWLFVVLSVATALFARNVFKQRESELQGEIARHVTQVSDLIVASTRYAMLENRREFARKIIEDIGNQKGIERVRVISKDGTIVHSNHSSEIGNSINQGDEPCVQCHRTSTPLKQVPNEQRWTFIETNGGHRSISAMHAIRNEPSCSTAACHQHSASQSVLGIVDIAYSLDETHQAMKVDAVQLVISSIGFLLLFSVSAGVLLQRLIYVPLKDLESGAGKIAGGNLDLAIPVRSGDEFGRVAGSFNGMTTALNEARVKMQELVQNLESKVAERTRELLAAKAAVAQGEKLAAIGVLASGIAHELNNPLTGVLTFTSLLRKKTADGTEDAADLDLVIRETKRCASIIRRLLDFAREKVPVNGLFDLNRVIAETVRFVERPVTLRQIEITTSLDPGLPQVWGDADLIKQVLINLLVNAEQAIEGSGRIEVQSRLRAATAGPEPGTVPGPMVEICVTDTGCGIAPDNLQRIFDPFFTSKDVGKGTGLGLSVSYGIVKAHGGSIEVESVVGAGSTFRVILPLASTPGETGHNAGEGNS